MKPKKFYNEQRAGPKRNKNISVISEFIIFDTKNKIPDAYERLLMDVVRGNQTWL